MWWSWDLNPCSVTQGPHALTPLLPGCHDTSFYSRTSRPYHVPVIRTSLTLFTTLFECILARRFKQYRPESTIHALLVNPRSFVSSLTPLIALKTQALFTSPRHLLVVPTTQHISRPTPILHCSCPLATLLNLDLSHSLLPLWRFLKAQCCLLALWAHNRGR